MCLIACSQMNYQNAPGVFLSSIKSHFSKNVHVIMSSGFDSEPPPSCLFSFAAQLILMVLTSAAAARQSARRADGRALIAPT